MRHQDIKLRELTTYEACVDAVLSIEADFRNYEGGRERWLSGKETFLLSGAIAKIKTIWAKADKFGVGNDIF